MAGKSEPLGKPLRNAHITATVSRQLLETRLKRIIDALAAETKNGTINADLSKELSQCQHDLAIFEKSQKRSETLKLKSGPSLLQHIFSGNRTIYDEMRKKAGEEEQKNESSQESNLIYKACQKLGGVSEVAGRIGVARETISRWLGDKKLVPTERLLEIQSILDQKS
jgi:transcriptional regulator with XRE-family HTH domain